MASVSPSCRQLSKRLPFSRGFTLIELLVVISIISLLSSVVFASVNGARSKARDVKRAADIRQVQTALEFYFDANGSYPVAAAWFGGTGNCWGTVTSNWVPGLVPNYMSALPLDPRPVNCSSVYLYASNGTDYKVIAHVPENCLNPAMTGIRDPARPCWAWAIYTQGAAAW